MNKRQQANFYKNMLQDFTKINQIPYAGQNGSFIYCDAEQLESVWNGFGGTEYCTVEYLIVIGRWSQLTKVEKDRLMYLNNQYDRLNLRIRTYDNLARKAFDEPKYFW